MENLQFLFVSSPVFLFIFFFDLSNFDIHHPRTFIKYKDYVRIEQVHIMEFISEMQ